MDTFYKGAFIIGCVFLALTLAAIATWMLAHGAARVLA